MVRSIEALLPFPQKGLEHGYKESMISLVLLLHPWVEEENYIYITLHKNCILLNFVPDTIV